MQRVNAVTGLAQFDIEQPGGERGRINRRVDEVQHMPDRAGVVFVSVRDDDAFDHQFALHLVNHVLEIGNDIVDTEHVVFREHDPGIDDDAAALVVNQHHVFADLTQSAEGQDAHFTFM